MNIVFLDAKTIGEDIDLSGYDKLGTVIKYGFSTTEEARERTKDADVVIEMLPDIPRRRWHSTHLPCYSISGKN